MIQGFVIYNPHSSHRFVLIPWWNNTRGTGNIVGGTPFIFHKKEDAEYAVNEGCISEIDPCDDLYPDVVDGWDDPSKIMIVPVKLIICGEPVYM